MSESDEIFVCLPEVSFNLDKHQQGFLIFGEKRFTKYRASFNLLPKPDLLTDFCRHNFKNIHHDQDNAS